MKKIHYPNIYIIHLNAGDLIVTSPESVNRRTVDGGDDNSFIQSRSYFYDDED